MFPWDGLGGGATGRRVFVCWHTYGIRLHADIVIGFDYYTSLKVDANILGLKTNNFLTRCANNLYIYNLDNG